MFRRGVRSEVKDNKIRKEEEDESEEGKNRRTARSIVGGDIGRSRGREEELGGIRGVEQGGSSMGGISEGFEVADTSGNDELCNIESIGIREGNQPFWGE